MKHLKLFLSAAIFASLALASCEDDWDTPPMGGPVATIEANTSIAELKEAFWSEDVNYVDTIGKKENGEHYIIKGRVISSDEAGNVYKNLVIQDTYEPRSVNPDGTVNPATCITLSINANSMYTSYRPGQEVVIDATDMYIGKYAGLQQFGLPEYKEAYGWQTTFMPLEFFQKHAQLNGLPEPEKIDTLITSISQLPTDAAGIRKFQSQLVRFDGVTFEKGGKDTFAQYQVTTSQNISDGTASMVVRTSGYADFYWRTLPEGEGSIVGILGYFNNTWQLTLRSYSDVIFGEALPGAKSNPYTVDAAIAEINAGKAATGWVSGVIVGALTPGVSSVASNSDIEWTAPATLPNTIVIAPDASVKDFTKCLVVDLPEGSELRKRANLADNPDNLGQPILIKGNLTKEYGMAAITGNTGSVSEFEFKSVTVVSSIDENFDRFGDSVTSGSYVDFSDSNLLGEGWSVVTLKGNKDWSMRRFDENNALNVYASISGYKGTAPFDAWLITPGVNADKLAEKVLNFRSEVNGYGSTTSHFEVYVLNSPDPATATLKEKLNPTLPEAPDSGYSAWTPSGNVDLSKYSGVIYIGFRYEATSDANYATWCIDDIVVGKKGADASANDGSEAKPYTVADVLAGASGADKWVTGYIVGYSSKADASSSAVFSAEGANNLNVLIADSADEKNVANCIAVGLAAGTTRNSVNLKDNPSNLGKKVAVQGTIGTVYKIPGLNANTFKF